jgi:hypothetical protein
VKVKISQFDRSVQDEILWQLQAHRIAYVAYGDTLSVHSLDDVPPSTLLAFIRVVRALLLQTTPQPQPTVETLLAGLTLTA